MDANTKAIKSCVIVINGFLGVGKLTLAKKLHAKFSPCRLLDYHLPSNAANTIVPAESPDRPDIVRSFRCSLFNVNDLKSTKEKNVAIIMTEKLAMEYQEDLNTFADDVEIARTRNMPLVLITLVCDKPSHMERLAERNLTGTVVDIGFANMFLDVLEHYTLLEPESFAIQNIVQGVEFHHFELDTTGQSVEGSFADVLSFLTKM